MNSIPEALHAQEKWIETTHKRIPVLPSCSAAKPFQALCDGRAVLESRTRHNTEAPPVAHWRPLLSFPTRKTQPQVRRLFLWEMWKECPVFPGETVHNKS